MQFTAWSVHARTEYGTQLRFGPYIILVWTAQSVNCQLAIKAMFYLLINELQCIRINVGTSTKTV